MPHIFSPGSNSLYSSNNEEKRDAKKLALRRATIENINRHNKDAWIHTPRKEDGVVVTKKIEASNKFDVNIQLYTKKGKNLCGELPKNEKLKIIECNDIEDINIAQHASRMLLEQAENYDILAYIEDDIVIEDAEFFLKIHYLQRILGDEYTVVPHRCEYMQDFGEVILSGDPETKRKDLFWNTGESREIKWNEKNIELYRATNPHSGCFFINSKQGVKLRECWKKRDWKSPFMLCGPLEHAASGRIIEAIKIMKTNPCDYRFLKVIHCDELWRRHMFTDE